MKWKTKKYHNVGTVLIFNRKIVERGKIDILNTEIYDRCLSLLGKGTSIRSGGDELVLSLLQRDQKLIIYTSHFLICLRIKMVEKKTEEVMKLLYVLPLVIYFIS
jgi:hypothetical protein